MSTFPRGHHARSHLARNARLLARLAPEKATRPTSWAASPMELRGIPALAPGVAGAMAGTRPDYALT